MKLDYLFKDISHWAEQRCEIAAVCVVGSHARGTARPDSDVDFVILCDTPSTLLADQSWRDKFGIVVRSEIEDWGALQALRTFYQSGVEIEFGITSISWASLPVDPGTQEVVSDGMKILYDPRGVLRELQAAVVKTAG